MADDKPTKPSKGAKKTGLGHEGLSIEGILERRSRQRQVEPAPADPPPQPASRAEAPNARFSLKSVMDLIANESRGLAPVSPAKPIEPVAEKAPEKAPQRVAEKISADARRKQAALERRLAREFALQLLYAARLGETSIEVAEARLLQHSMTLGWDDDIRLHIPSPALRSFSRQLGLRAVEATDRYNEMLAQRLTNWRIERLEAIDRMLLHLAVAELELFKETSHRIVLNEFIEIAKDYGSDQSPRFINGVLDALIPVVRPGVQSKGRAGDPAERASKKSGKGNDKPNGDSPASS